MKTITLSIVFATGLSLPALGADFQLAPHKNALFAYPAVLEKSKSGDYRLVDFIKQRDVYGRDRIPLRKAHFKYVNEGVRWSRRVRTYKSANGEFKYFSTGKKQGARVTVIWIHGKGGNRRQGVNDWTFGGNFNRLQNLMTKNKGILLSPDFTNFKAKGTTDITSLMAEYKRRSPNGAMIIACGSMGSGICWRLAKAQKTASQIDGMFFLGSHWDNGFLKSQTAKKPSQSIPLFFGHGTQDGVYKATVQHSFFNKIKKINPAYPARFVMFNTGVHGTPIRMVDWRRELNWMLSLKK